MLKLCNAPDAMIHHSVGIDSTSRYGDPGRQRWPTLCSSTIPRAGSRMKRAATAQSNPGTAAMKSAALQPQRCPTYPPTRKLKPNPIGNPSMKVAVARARCWVRNRSPMREIAAGAQLGLPDTDAETDHEQLPEVARQPRGGREQAPDEHAAGENVLAHTTIGQAAERDADEGVKQGERGPQRAQRGIAECTIPAESVPRLPPESGGRRSSSD